MRHKLAAYLDNVITVLLFLVAGATPLLFLNQMTEFYEMPKLVMLVVATLVLLGVWIFSWIVKGKIIITRTPLDIPLLLLMVVILASTYFSATREAAIYGNFPKVHGSAVAWVTYILLYFVTVSHLKTLGRIKSFLYVLYGSGVAVSVITLLSFFGIFLPFDFARGVNFTPTGSAFSTIAFLVLLLPLSLLSVIKPNNYLPLPFAVVLSALFGATIALIGSVPSLIVLLVTYVLCVVVAKPYRLKKTLPFFAIPVAVTALTLAAAYLPLPGPLNVLHQTETNFPKEIQLPFPVSWKISASAFRDAPFFGHGPSSYPFNFTTYKPAEFNALSFWNFSFDTAYNEFLQVLGTLGFFGLMALLFFCVVVLNSSRKNLSLNNYEEGQEHNSVVAPALAVSGILTIILMAIHATTLVSIMASLFVLAALMMSQRSIRERVMELSMGIKASTADNRQFDLLPVITFIVFLALAVTALYRGFYVVAADYYHRLALSHANTNGALTYQYLQRAETLNPLNDLYRVDMAETNFALANALVTQKGPTEANPQGTLTDADRQTIQTLLSQSITEGRAAVTLNPRSARNWSVLASVYRNISGVADNALAFSLDAYGRAIQTDPLNPSLRLNVGGIYYAVGNYDLAIRFFTDAINLKPDYTNAYYNLSIALRDKNDLDNAILVAEQTIKLLETNKESQEYKTAVALLDELNKKKAGAAGEQTTGEQQAPAAQTGSALQNENVGNVNVNSLNNPPQVTPVPTVRPNPSVRVPQVSPTQAPVPTQAQ